MNIINNYFEFKKMCLISYASVFLDDSKNYQKYLDAYIQTYIDTYYNHILNTYYDEEVKRYNDRIIIKEMKGKKLELLDELTDKTRNESKLINKCYKYAFIAVVIDLISFKKCNKVNEFKDVLKNTLIDSKKLMLFDDNLLDKLGSLVKENVLKERRFFSSLKTDDFNITFCSYKDSRVNFKVFLDYHIPALDKSYTKDVIDKNYRNDKVQLNKFEATLNLLNINMLKRIMTNNEICRYFIDVPLASIEKREDLEEFIKSVDNPRIKDNIVFIINYNDYTSKKSLFKNLSDFNFAICIDLSRTIVIEKRLAEIESFDIFNYVIIDGVKKENLQLVENYVIKGKIMFMNELNMM